jgi:hypothetical protein
LIRLFLYLVLLAVFTGTIYFVYKTWIETLFPQTKRSRGKGGDRTKRSAPSTPGAVSPKDQVLTGADGSAVTSGVSSKAYDESWIPDHIINRPKAKRVQSGATAKSKSKVAAE